MRSAVLLFVLLSAAALLPAQEQDKPAAQKDTVYVSADGKYETAPDTAVVQFNISAQDDTARGAYDRAGKAAEQVRQILRSSGIDPSQAQIGFFSIQPVYDWKTPKHKVLAYQVNSAVVVKLTDFSKVAPIVAQFSDMDVTSNQSVNYTLENLDAAKQKAVANAYERARASAETIAHNGGRPLGELEYASVDTYEQVPVIAAPRMAMAMAGAAAPNPTAEFTPQKIQVMAHVNALFELK